MILIKTNVRGKYIKTEDADYILDEDYSYIVKLFGVPIFKRARRRDNNFEEKEFLYKKNDSSIGFKKK